MKKTIVTSGSIIVGLIMMVSTQGIISAQDNENESDLDQIKTELSSRTLSFEFKDTQFREVINRIRQQVSFNIIISDKVDQMLDQDGGNANQGGNQAGGENANNGFGGGFGGSDSGNSSGGFGNSGSSNNGGGFGSSGGNNSSGGSGSSSGGGSGGFGSSGDSSSGGFGSSDSGGGFGSSGGDSSGGFGSSGGSGFGDSGGSSGFGNAGGRAGAGNQPANIDDKVTIKLDDVTIMRALKLILNQKNLTAVYKLGAVHIVPKDQAQNYNIRFYDVRDLQYKLEDFKSNVTRFHQAGGYTGSSDEEGRGSSEGFLSNQMFGKEGGSDKEIITNEKEFMKLIKNNVGSQQDWQGKASMRMTNGILVVNQTEEVHDDIDFLINRLRQFK